MRQPHRIGNPDPGGQPRAALRSCGAGRDVKDHAPCPPSAHPVGQGATSSTRCSMTDHTGFAVPGQPLQHREHLLRPTGSRSDSGSSSTSTRGRIASVAAIAVRCFCPPDSVTTEGHAHRVHARHVQARVQPGPLSPAGAAPGSPARTPLRRHRLVDQLAGSDFWNTMPTSWEASCGFMPLSARAAERDPPRGSPCTGRGSARTAPGPAWTCRSPRRGDEYYSPAPRRGSRAGALRGPHPRRRTTHPRREAAAPDAAVLSAWDAVWRLDSLRLRRVSPGRPGRSWPRTGPDGGRRSPT